MHRVADGQLRGLRSAARPTDRLYRRRARRAGRRPIRRPPSSPSASSTKAAGMQLILHAPVRRSPQQGLGAGAAQALLPRLQLRAAGCGNRQRHQHLAGRAAQLPALGRLPVPDRAHREGVAGTSRHRLAHLQDALALGGEPLAAAAADVQGQAHRRRRFSAPARKTCSPASSRRPQRALRPSWAISRFPIIRWSTR